ncbi:unnamed protein product [Vicia faba]|uniref:WRKY domain-containing protein n=1 Tax=Vicia faba TaxID=3906 RepID=A0AAV0YIH3_VICFA|nr:unnamed protein product [Vicia faba]
MDNNISQSVRKRLIIKELVKGQEAANKLRFLLQNDKNPFGCDDVGAGIDPPSGDAGNVVKKSSRGCYKRRKCGETWSIVSETIVDNHSWRKSYFRCAFKYDQGCLAIKQVNHHITSPTPSIIIKQEDPFEENTASNVTDKQKQELMDSDDIADAVLVFQSLGMEFGDIDFHFD